MIQIKKTFAAVSGCVGLIGLTLLFQNCSGKSTFTQLTPSQVAQQAILNCEQARAEGRLVVASNTIHFPKPTVAPGKTDVCRWEENGNLAKTAGAIAARYEQEASFSLPENAQLCDMTFNFEPQLMKYDDRFFISYNDVILASDSSWAVEKLNKRDAYFGDSSMGVGVYDWEVLRGTRSPSDAQSRPYPYCIGQEFGLAHCEWPITEVSGTISIELDPQLVVNLGLLQNVGGAHKFKWITTGDNDPGSDCIHEPVTFNVTTKYILE